LTMSSEFQIRPVGTVESSLLDRADAPLQADEGAPPAWLAFDESVREALNDVKPGDELLLLTWLDRADRTVQVVRPRSDPRNPLTGVFNTRSPDRPNPIGVHRVRVTARDGMRVLVGSLEAIDGTPIVDVKAVLCPGER
jgi:tRNA-Thr(GGU) m(6)t(6)A37 methyltransferase TsaA